MAANQRSSGVLSFSPRNVEAVFDISDPARVIALLNFIRGSALPIEVKNDARNAVLDYVSTEAPEALLVLQECLSGLLATVVAGGTVIYENTPPDSPAVMSVAESSKEEEMPVATSEVAPLPAAGEVVRGAGLRSAIGHTRPTPRFSPGVSTPTVAPRTTRSPEPTIAPLPPTPPSGEVIPDTSRERTVPIRIIDKKAEPVLETPPAVPVTPPEKESISPRSDTEVTSSEKKTASPRVQSTAARDRINQIKKEINTKVGNHAHLMAIDEGKGRAYMMALVAAMKAQVGGTAEEVERTMGALETAYEAVHSLLATEGGVVSREETVAKEPPHVPGIKKVSEPSTPPIVATPEPIVAPREEEIPVAVAPIADFIAPEAEMVEAVLPTPAPVGPLGVSVAEKVQAEERERDVVFQSALARRSEAEQEAARIAATNPLMAHEVTAGLDQLLSEWKLFRSSGFFGTGPAGREHPLFKTLAPLSMMNIIAGRFDGATPEIRQSIADYMNGWRYEQGIVHDHGETFEHYLRRVITDIIAGQKAAKQP